jgi:opacity protein-like surface antigen
MTPSTRGASCIRALAVAGVCAALFTPAARAQDGFDWSGPYGTVSLGGFRSDGGAELNDVQGFLLPADVELGVLWRDIENTETSPALGLAFGTNFQSGSFVNSIEAGLTFLGHDGRTELSEAGPFPPPASPLTVTTETSYRTEIDTMGSLRWRGGYAAGRNLFYVSAGIAAADVRNEFGFGVPDLPPPFPRPYAAPTASVDGIRWGYTVGVGFERAIGERWSVRAEIVHYDLADADVRGRDLSTPGFDREAAEYTFENRGTTALLGLSFAF